MCIILIQSKLMRETIQILNLRFLCNQLKDGALTLRFLCNQFHRTLDPSCKFEDCEQEAFKMLVLFLSTQKNQHPKTTQILLRQLSCRLVGKQI